MDILYISAGAKSSSMLRVGETRVQSVWDALAMNNSDQGRGYIWSPFNFGTKKSVEKLFNSVKKLMLYSLRLL